MDLKKILKNYGIDEEKVEDLKDAITREIGTDFIPKTQYNKKVLALEEQQAKINDLEAKLSNVDTDEYKNKYAELEKEFEQFKSNIENEKTLNTKTDLLRNKLQGENFNKDIIDLLIKEFDFNNIEIEDNNIKEWDNLVTPLKDKYKSFIQVESVQGSTPATPPTSINKTFSKEDIEKMSPEEINANWDMVSKSLNNI